MFERGWSAQGWRRESSPVGTPFVQWVVERSWNLQAPGVEVCKFLETSPLVVLMDVENVLSQIRGNCCWFPIVGKMHSHWAVVEHGGPRATITWTLFPIVVPAEVVTTVMTSLWKTIFLDRKVVILYCSKKSTFSKWDSSFILFFKREVWTVSIYHRHVYHRILIVCEWLYACLYSFIGLFQALWANWEIPWLKYKSSDSIM